MAISTKNFTCNIKFLVCSAILVNETNIGQCCAMVKKKEASERTGEIVIINIDYKKISKSK